MTHTDVGDELLVTHVVRDLDGVLTDAASVTLTVTLPDLTTEQPSVTNPETGHYEVAYTLTQAGRYVFAWQTTDPDTAEASAVEAVEPDGLPTVPDVQAYMEDAALQWNAAQLTEALEAETAAQRRICRVGAVYPADLREALLRRVARNLAMRAIPLAVLTGDAEQGGSNLTLPGRDPEVRRLEAPHRKVVIG